jgi:hypothetical protein
MEGLASRREFSFALPGGLSPAGGALLSLTQRAVLLLFKKK